MKTRNPRHRPLSIETLEGRAALSGGLTSSLAGAHHAHSHAHTDVHKSATATAAAPVGQARHSGLDDPANHDAVATPAAAHDDPANHDVNDDTGARHGGHDGAGHK